MSRIYQTLSSFARILFDCICVGFNKEGKKGIIMICMNYVVIICGKFLPKGQHFIVL